MDTKTFLSAGFFILIWVLNLILLFNRKPLIILSETGIYSRTTHRDFINWEIIKDAYVATGFNTKYICLVVDDNFLPSGRKGKTYKMGVNIMKATGLQELNIRIGNAAVNTQKLLDFILAMRHAKKPARQDIIINALHAKFKR